MYKRQTGALLQKLWCNEEARYISNIIQRAKSCYPKTLPPQAKEKGLDLAEPHSSQMMPSQWLFFPDYV